MSIFCQKCGAEWDTATTPHMKHFASAAESEWTSPLDIEDAGLAMIRCPKCPMEPLDSAMKIGDGRRVPDEN